MWIMTPKYKILAISLVIATIIGVPASFGDISTTTYGLDLLALKLDEIINQVNSNTNLTNSNTIQITSSTNNITSNTNQINTNNIQINLNTNQTNSNTNQINTISTQSTNNANQISTIDTNVTTNTNDISTNTNQITLNTNQVNTHTIQISNNDADISQNQVDITNILANSNSNNIWISGKDLQKSDSQVIGNYDSLQFPTGQGTQSGAFTMLIPDSWNDQPVNITFYYIQEKTGNPGFPFQLVIGSHGLNESLSNIAKTNITFPDQFKSRLAEYTLNNFAVDTDSDDPLMRIQIQSAYTQSDVSDLYLVGMIIEY